MMIRTTPGFGCQNVQVFSTDPLTPLESVNVTVPMELAVFPSSWMVSLEMEHDFQFR